MTSPNRDNERVNAQQVDPCALFDLDVVRKVAGQQPLSIGPTALNRCDLYTGEKPEARDWALGATVDGLVPDGSAESIGGMSFRVQERDKRCSYSTMTSEAYGLSFDAHWQGLKDPPKPACSVVKEYLTATIARWEKPSKRSEGRTQPALPLALVDPCIANEALQNRLGKAQTVRTSPHVCGLVGDSNVLPAPGVIIQFLFDEDPEWQPLQHPKTYEPAEVRGEPASVMTLSDCVVSVRYNPDTVIKFEETRVDDLAHNQVIKVRAATCGLATSAAETVIDRIAQSPPPAIAQPVQGAVKLGDLNPPPGWQQVGAPVDPCTVIGWDAFPSETRGLKAARPIRHAAREGDIFKAACKFTVGSADVTFDKNKAGSDASKVTDAFVIWGDEASGMTVNAAKRAGSATKQYGGKPGLEATDKDMFGRLQCTSVVRTSRGYWGALVRNGAFPNTNTCAISTAMLTAIAAKVP